MMDSIVAAMTNPLVILLIGVVTVVGMIIVLRANAFIALITAAMLVSLLSPGALGEKIIRVAEAFGSSAGKIGIVIALAAVIGKCLMDSGAADRIVRSFLRVLGEKRGPEALNGASFVLAMPVFFDTVFYLLIPLARSLHRRTKKHYVLYILAIATGGVITHGMVPPTPGPLAMASTLNINLGVMILTGISIGLPTAVVGLLVARVFDRLLDIPMRPYSGEPEPEPLADDELPGLWISLAPVVLPVLLISASTILDAWADNEHAARLSPGSVSDWAGFTAALTTETDGQAHTVAGRVVQQLGEDLRKTVHRSAEAGSLGNESQQEFRRELNLLLTKKDLFDEKTLVLTDLPGQAEAMLKRGLKKLSQAKVEHFNRLVLETAFTEQIRPHVWDTPRRKTANVMAVPGNPNLALLISAAIALGLVFRQRGLTLKQLAKTTETALMSGGVIILITAGGGAFGEMLRTAGVGDTVENFVGKDGQTAGLVLLGVGFVVASVMKIAQGSGTVSMITTAGMMAPMTAMLGCHPVYLAIAIASGSHVGSWMNDSGFWIFARMSGLTEVEALKTWTIHLSILGVVGGAFTLLAAWLVPMT